MLFTKISLDDFPDCFERFLERLKEELWALQRARDDWPSLGSGAAAPFSDREWFMLGIINISALLQYGAEDGVLKKLMARDSPAENGDGGSGGHHGSSRSSGRSAHHSSSRHGGASTATLNGGIKSRAAPQAIMVKRSDADAGDDETERASSTSASTVVGGGDVSDVVKQLNPFDGALDSPEDDPLVFKLAQRLSFSLLSFLIDAPFRPIGTTTVPNPYVTLLVTFLAHLSHHPSALKHLERAIPWSHLATLFNAIPSSVEVRLDTPSKLVGGRPLPEDWCLRGMDWAGRQLFGRGYWREHRHRAAAAGGSGGDGLPPPIEGVEGATVRVESEMDALKFDLAALEDAAAASSTTDDEPGAFGGPGASGAAVQLAESRWRRLAICAAWLVRNVPGFDYDVRAIQPRSRFRVSGTLQVKLERWAQEDEDEREAERLSRLSIEEKAGGLVGGVEDEDSLEESDGEDDENEGDSIEVKELKVRLSRLVASASPLVLTRMHDRRLADVSSRPSSARRAPRLAAPAVRAGSRRDSGARRPRFPRSSPATRFSSSTPTSFSPRSSCSQSSSRPSAGPSSSRSRSSPSSTALSASRPRSGLPPPRSSTTSSSPFAATHATSRFRRAGATTSRTSRSATSRSTSAGPPRSRLTAFRRTTLRAQWTTSSSAPSLGNETTLRTASRSSTLALSSRSARSRATPCRSFSSPSIATCASRRARGASRRPTRRASRRLSRPRPAPLVADASDTAFQSLAM